MSASNASVSLAAPATLTAWATPATRVAGRRGGPAQTRPEIRAVGIGVLGGIALSLVIFQYQFRDLEAYVAAHLYGVVTPALNATNAPIIWFGLPGANAFGLDITPDCSSALLLVPLCCLGMLLMIPRKLPLRRVVKALLVSAALLVSGNMLRIGVIAMTTRLGGLGAGYEFGHLVLGSAISVVCIAASLILLITVVSQDGVRAAVRRHRHRRTAK